VSVLFFAGLALFSVWDIFRLAKEKKKREMVIYIIIAALSVAAGIVSFFSDASLSGALNLDAA
jgi:uncharacterized membrane protein